MSDYYANLDHIKDDAEDPDFGPAAQAERVVRTASNIVKSMAAEPDPITPKFTKDARDATIAVFWYLWDTGGYVALKRSPTDSSVGYAANPRILELVKMSLGENFRAPGGAVLMGGMRRKGARSGSSASYAPPDPYQSKGRE